MNHEDVYRHNERHTLAVDGATGMGPAGAAGSFPAATPMVKLLLDE